MNANTAFSYRFSELTCYDWSHHAGNGGKGVGDSQQDPSKPAHTHTHRFCETQIAAGFTETPPEFHVAVRLRRRWKKGRGRREGRRRKGRRGRRGGGGRRKRTKKRRRRKKWRSKLLLRGSDVQVVDVEARR